MGRFYPVPSTLLGTVVDTDVHKNGLPVHWLGGGLGIEPTALIVLAAGKAEIFWTNSGPTPWVVKKKKKCPKKCELEEESLGRLVCSCSLVRDLFSGFSHALPES